MTVPGHALVGDDGEVRRPRIGDATSRTAALSITLGGLEVDWDIVRV